MGGSERGSGGDGVADDVLACVADVVNNTTTASSRSAASDQIDDKGQINSGAAAIDKDKEQKMQFS